MTQEAAIEQCRQMICRKLNCGDSTTWTNEDFETLSDRIFDTTNTRLSVSTLKRVWGKVRYDSNPTTATLNALARYAGFEGWRDFQNKTEPQIAGAPQIREPQQAEEPQKKPQAPKRDRYTTPIIIITATVIALLSLLITHLIRPNTTPPEIKFQAHRITDQLPNSVVFDYDAAPLHPHSVIIQQSWDIKRREAVDPEGKQHTSIYYSPGFFRAKLLIDGAIKKETDVFIPSNGWKGIIQKDPAPIYLRKEETKTNKGYMGITAETLKEKTGSGIFTGVFTDFANVREFPGITGNDFTVETTVRNTSTVEECLCRRIQLLILGTSSAIIIPLCDKGCISEIDLYYGSGGISGKNYDLSAFGCEFPKWQTLRCTETNNRIEINLNGKTIFTKDKVRSIGNIVGVRVQFEGSGEIKDLFLKSPTETLDLIKDPNAPKLSSNTLAESTPPRSAQ